ncbi:MAG: hypothetical protein F6K34_21495 [Okeania sp. SIO4D6]|nr:hypothetical protein [Okeania sp. SIO4D6]
MHKKQKRGIRVKIPVSGTKNQNPNPEMSKSKPKSKSKSRYRVSNWSEYDASLKQRGNLTFWRA